MIFLFFFFPELKTESRAFVLARQVLYRWAVFYFQEEGGHLEQGFSIEQSLQNGSGLHREGLGNGRYL